jgi:hypothetical protein
MARKIKIGSEPITAIGARCGRSPRRDRRDDFFEEPTVFLVAAFEISKWFRVRHASSPCELRAALLRRSATERIAQLRARRDLPTLSATRFALKSNTEGRLGAANEMEVSYLHIHTSFTLLL